MGNKLKVAGGVATGLIAGGASMFFVGRETAPETRVEVSSNSQENIQRVIDLAATCSNTVITFALGEYPLTENIIGTPLDESTESMDTQKKAGQERVDSEYTTCFDNGLKELGLEFDEVVVQIDKSSIAPTFTPELPVEVTVTTEG